MTKNHTIIIYVENAKIGCPYCDEWEPFFGTRGGDTQFLCDELLKDHLRRKELSFVSQRVLNALYKGVYVNNTFREKGISTALRELAALCQYEIGGGDMHKIIVNVGDIYAIADELEGFEWVEDTSQTDH